ncbi:hypothetical protein D3C81_1832920 [compost metagenome]
MCQDHAQVQQHIGNRAPLRIGITTLMGVQHLLDFTDALPDPDRSPRRAAEKIRGNIEQRPAAVTQQGPSSLCIG